MGYTADQLLTILAGPHDLLDARCPDPISKPQSHRKLNSVLHSRVHLEILREAHVLSVAACCSVWEPWQPWPWQPWHPRFRGEA